MTTENTKTDVINTLAGIAEGSPLAALRAQRPDAKQYTQGSDEALLNPEDVSGVSLIEREAIGLRIGTLTKNLAVTTRHRNRLNELQADAAIIHAAVSNTVAQASSLSPRLSAILHFTTTLTLSPRLASPVDIAQLRDAGVSDAQIVTIAQLISYLNYQVRLLAGLRALGGE